VRFLLAVTRRFVRTAFVVALSVMAVGCRGNNRMSAQAPGERTLRLVTASPGSSSYRIATALIRAFRASASDIEWTLLESAGSIHIVNAIQDGNADVGFVFADVAYMAFSGHLSGRPFHRLRGVAVLQPTTFHFLVARDSAIRSIADLRGRRVSVGMHGSGSAVAATLVLSSFGIDPEAVQFDSTPANEAAHNVRVGQLEAMLVMATDPYDPVTVATAAGARLLPIEGAAVERLRHDSPFVHLATIPERTYPGQLSRIHTIGIDSVLVCRSDLDEQVVYRLTKQFFDTLPSLVPAETSLRLIDLLRVDATPIPLHRGATRYYRARELSR
jgi:uncharacterized protein